MDFKCKLTKGLLTLGVVLIVGAQIEAVAYEFCRTFL